MPQRFYLDEQNLDTQLEKLDRNLYEMLDFAYLHEDMINTINELMSEWGKENLNTFKEIEDQWEQLSDDYRDDYENIDEFLCDFGRWWIETEKLSDDEKISLIHRYRMTISTCLFSDTYCHDTIKENIESYMS
jgi:hypothetical protein